MGMYGFLQQKQLTALVAREREVCRKHIRNVKFGILNALVYHITSRGRCRV